jgi:IS6 family transposase
VFRWAQRYAPEINKRIRQHLKMSGTSYRVDETYIKVGKSCKYLYRAVDKEGNTIEFMLSAKRDVSAAKRFFKKMMRAEHRCLPFTIGTDKHASYPEAFATSVNERVPPPDCKLRRVKYLNNVIEQDHRAVRRRWHVMQCFRSFHTAGWTLEGVEAMHMMRKGQVKRLDGRTRRGRRSSSKASSLSPRSRRPPATSVCLKSIFATQPSQSLARTFSLNEVAKASG